MKPSPRGNGAKAGPSTSKKQANGRLPQAPSSLLVQLPPDELRKYQQSALQSGNVSGSLVQASDVHLLASSIQERRDREARVFQWQQKLIDADKILPRDELKRAVSIQKPSCCTSLIMSHTDSSLNCRFRHGFKCYKRDISMEDVRILAAHGSQRSHTSLLDRLFYLKMHQGIESR